MERKLVEFKGKIKAAEAKRISILAEVDRSAQEQLAAATTQKIIEFEKQY
jgi:uncharacterized HAD superfamily protein